MGGTSILIVDPRGYRTSELKRAFSVDARSARASSTAARRSGGPSSADDELDSAGLGRAQRDLDPRQRSPPNGLLGRLAQDLVQSDGGVLAELVRVLDVEVDLDVVTRGDAACESFAAAANPS